MKVVATNKRALFDYEVLSRLEAGLELKGGEVKSIREGHVQLRGSFVSVRGGEAFWKGGFIKHWKYATGEAIDEARDRKLLLHKKELLHITKALNERGITIVPLNLKLVRGRAKLEIALARGKKKYDKRDTIKRRDVAREIAVQMKIRK